MFNEQIQARDKENHFSLNYQNSPRAATMKLPMPFFHLAIWQDGKMSFVKLIEDLV